MALEVLFEDNHLLVVNKKAGQLVQKDKTGENSLIQEVETYLRHKYKKEGNIFVGLPHRLDRPTSGIVVLAKTSKALVRLNNMLRDKQIDKTYWAVTEQRPENYEGRLEHYLVKNEKNNKSKAYNSSSKNSKKAVLTYETFACSRNFTLLEIKLITGRHHQIRAQLAKISCHIKGDLKYGAKRSNKDGSIHLHARKVEFEHPITKKKIIIVALPPDEQIWNIFKSNY